MNKSERKSIGQFLMNYSTIILIIVIAILFAITAKGFLQPSNLVNILSQSSILAIVAAGLCFIVTIGGIDLSFTISYDIGAMVSVMLMAAGIPWYIALIAGFAAGALLGVVNGTLVVKAKIAIFIATLGMMYIGESAQKIFTQGGQPIYLPSMPEAFKFMGKGNVLTVIGDGFRLDFRFSIIIAAIVVLLVYFVLQRTTFGRKLFAIGSQRDAASLAGVPVGRYTFYAFVICGAISAFGGMLNASTYTAFLPISGKYYLMDAIGAVFVGCTLNKRGYVNIGGTMLGVIFFGMISNGLNLLGIAFEWQSVARGVLIFIIIAMDAYKKASLMKKK